MFLYDCFEFWTTFKSFLFFTYFNNRSLQYLSVMKLYFRLYESPELFPSNWYCCEFMECYKFILAVKIFNQSENAAML